MIRLFFRFFVGVFTLLSTALPLKIFGQAIDYSFEQISIRQGLSQSTVNCVMQDKKGFMWLGTRTGGLNKFDGYTFTQYNHDPDDTTSISGNEILLLFEDKEGDIWVGTRNAGLNRYDHETEIFERFLHENDDKRTIPHNTINGVLEVPNGEIWIATNNGICIFNEESRDFSLVINTMDGKRSHLHVTKVCMGPEGNLIAGTKKGIYVIDTDSKQTIARYQTRKGDDTSLSGSEVYTLFFDTDQRLWVGTRKNGLNRMDDVTKDEFIRFEHEANNPESLISDIVRTVHEDQSGDIWIGTKNGLDLIKRDQKSLNEPKFTHFQNNENDDKSISQNSIYSFYEDNKGNFWIGTWSGGVNYVYNGIQKFEHLKHLVNNESTLSNNFVSSFAIGQEGVWVGTEAGGLNLYDRETKKFTVYKSEKGNSNSLVSDHIKSLVVDTDGNLWVGTYKGLHLYDSENETFKLFLKGRSIYSVMEGEPNEIWAGTDRGLFVIDKSGEISKTYLPSKEDEKTLSHHSIYVLHKDAEGQIWIGTKLGFNCYNKQKDNFDRFIYDPKDPSSLSHVSVTSITHDNANNIWVGTLDGLNKLNPDKKSFTRFGKKAGLPDNSVSNLIADNRGSLWITTNKGLTKATVSKKDPRKFDVRNYDMRDGLQDYEFIQGASFKSKSGELFFGGINGFNVFHPDRVMDNKEIPEIALTNFKLSNKEVEIGTKNSPLTKHISETDEITLKYNQDVLTFGFVALNYTSTEKNQYAYMMKGFDEDWVEVGARREAYYTNLPAGDYTFKVKGSNNDNVWNEEGTSLNITVLPPWWETVWFRVLVIVVLMAIFYYIYRSRSERTKAEKRRLEDKILEATSEIKVQNDALAQEHLRLREAIKETNQVIGQAVESGDFNARVETSNKQGEWKQLAESINSMFESLLQPFKNINLVIDQLAQGDLTSRYSGSAKGDIRKLADNLNLAIENLSDLLKVIIQQSRSIGDSTHEMMTNSEEMNYSTTEISSAISEMSRGAMEQQSQIDESSQLLEDILSSANDMIQDAEAINDTANAGTEISQEGIGMIEKLDQSMQRILNYSLESNESIAELTDGSTKITAVIRIIKEIAAQTNLLALNAAIEAAQAGEAGRGFAVVADEIRKLAEDSKSSVGEIENLISAVQKNTGSTAQLISDMGEQIKTGDEVSKSSLIAFQEIAKHYQETFSKSEQIVKKVKKQTSDVQDVVNISRGIVVISEETASGTEEVASSANELAAGMTNYASKTREVSRITEELVKKVSTFKI